MGKVDCRSQLDVLTPELVHFKVCVCVCVRNIYAAEFPGYFFERHDSEHNEIIA